MDSFGVDSNIPSTPPAVQQTVHVVQQLKIAPKWMKRPCGASFAVFINVFNYFRGLPSFLVKKNFGVKKIFGRNSIINTDLIFENQLFVIKIKLGFIGFSLLYFIKN